MTEREILTFTKLRPVFDRHAVPEADRLFLYRAFDTLLEEDSGYNETAAETVAKGYLGADAYEDLLHAHSRGHRRNRAWFRSEAFEEAYPTRRGRALLRDLAAVNPDWQDHAEAATA
ncbi:hypothetical protein [Methylorubrum sp. DB1722]|uniref:hypothetical protein n=1 Tax=Methylorubrum sp. DB1722 TaxID=2478916 RepID=UPI0018E2D517|nr:hypothetical protein [Methylorubrum sp. DB1722]MBI1689487.1 hypothetical protein [Methylorubrum sp. DB1722]